MKSASFDKLYHIVLEASTKELIVMANQNKDDVLIQKLIDNELINRGEF